MPPITTLINEAIWLFLIIYWFIAARGTKKTVQLEHPVEQGIVFALFVVYGMLLLQSAWLPILPHTLVLGATGCIISTAGAGFALWARLTLGRNWSGAVVTVKENHELIKTGPYALVRHPIYTGFLIMALGSFIAIGGTAQLLGFLYLALAFFIRIIREERMMTHQFPTAYPEYKKHSKTLIPFIW